MFDIGFQELVVIFVIVLLVFGPKRLPEISRTLGKWVGELRKGIYDARLQMESEFENIQAQTSEESKAKIAEGGTAEAKPGEEAGVKTAEGEATQARPAEEAGVKVAEDKATETKTAEEETGTDKGEAGNK